jgi:hypothetical protein
VNRKTPFEVVEVAVVVLEALAPSNETNVVPSSEPWNVSVPVHVPVTCTPILRLSVSVTLSEAEMLCPFVVMLPEARVCAFTEAASAQTKIKTRASRRMIVTLRWT